MLGLRCCTGSSLVVGSWGGGGLLYLPCVGFLIAVASVVSEHGLSSGHTWAWLLLGLGDLPRPGIERMSPALAGG